jgi:16S rRNA (guanine966-N2)-methyltransferase
MRVVAGELRGRRIEAPPGTDTRPTTDMVREAVFNALGSRDAIHDAKVADLFAGTGALGIEAISRGASHCTFVERDRTALRWLRQNLDHLAIDARCRVMPGDALVLARGLNVDIVFADPPYDFDQWPALLAVVNTDFVVAESGREIDPVDGWEITRSKRYGRSVITFFDRIVAEPG